MKNKQKLIGILLLFVIIVAAFYWSVAAAQSKPAVKDQTVQQFMKTKIEYYSKNTFKFMKQIEVQDIKGNTTVSISLVPEVGSEVIKEDIYRSLAAHAVDVNKFFSEVKTFKYSILWDDRKKSEVMQLTIDEQGVKQLSKKYNDLLIDEKGGNKSSFKSIFSTVKESGEAKKWRNN
jgi:hypothetical protein